MNPVNHHYQEHAPLFHYHYHHHHHYYHHRYGYHHQHQHQHQHHRYYNHYHQHPDVAIAIIITITIGTYRLLLILLVRCRPPVQLHILHPYNNLGPLLGKGQKKHEVDYPLRLDIQRENEDLSWRCLHLILIKFVVTNSKC